MLTVLVTRLALIATQLVVSGLLTRALGAEGYGQLGLVILVVNLAYISSGWTTDLLAARGRVAVVEGRALAQVFWARMQLIAWPVAGVVIVMLLGAAPITRFLEADREIIWPLILYVLGFAGTYTVQALLQALGRLRTLSVLQLGERLIVIGGAAALLASGGGVAVSVVWWYAAASIIHTVLGLVIAYRAGALTPVAIDAAERLRLTTDGLRYVPGLFLATVLIWADLAILRLLGDPAASGRYTVSLQAAEAIRAVSGSMGLVFVPELAGRLASAASVTRATVAQRTPEAALVWASVLAAGAAVAPEGLRVLFGESFAASAPIFLVLVLGLALNVPALLWQSLLLADGRTSRLSASAGIALATKIALAWALAARFGAMGVASATALASTAAAVWLLIATPDGRRALPAALAATVPLALVVAARLWLPDPRGIAVALVLGVTTAALGARLASARNRRSGGDGRLLGRLRLPQWLSGAPALVLVLVAAPLVSGAQPLSAAQARRAAVGREVVAFFNGWYDTPSRWRSTRGILVAEQPADGWYRSADPATLRRQVREAREAGLTAFAASWAGRHDPQDTVLALLLAEAARQGFRVAAFLEHAPDSTSLEARLDEIVARFAAAPAYARAPDGRPIVFVYRTAVSAAPNAWWRRLVERRRDLLIAAFADGATGDDGTTFELSWYYTWVHEPWAYRSVSRVRERLARHLTESAELRHAAGRSFGCTVEPGFDNRHYARRFPASVPAFAVPRSGGAYYEARWAAVHEAPCDWVLVTSWNEWYEGTAIEPSRAAGRRYVQITRRGATRFLGHS